MNASQQIYQVLESLVDGKCYPLFIPEGSNNTLPYIVYQIVATDPHNVSDGITGHEWARVQIDVYSDDYDGCLALSQKAIHALNAIQPSEYLGQSLIEEDNLFRAIIEYGFWQTINA